MGRKNDIHTTATPKPFRRTFTQKCIPASTSDNFSPRKLNKALRDRMRLMSSVSQYISVWVRVEGGFLFLVSGPLVVTEIAFSFLSEYRATGGYTESLLYRGTGRKLFHEIVQRELEAGHVQSGRSYGASR